MDTIKIKPSHESQGDHVVINAEDFDPAVHQALDTAQAADESKTDELPRRRGRPSKEQA